MSRERSTERRTHRGGTVAYRSRAEEVIGPAIMGSSSIKPYDYTTTLRTFMVGKNLATASATLSEGAVRS
ncbi:hypothetical protein PROFUN_08039 [Planoprotostelium fungivorum]|uniref:Uncharacterized protein n=1 Tax=Planoprotostelium fungivorum TaxID=1890364 RepID=A0A2P6NKG7_9EUKA|nr:hypothetical protein PROFUN_08039 [Planoprotostelium fungivorum]